MSNLVNVGILPLIFNSEHDSAKIAIDDELHIADITKVLNKSLISVQNLTRGYSFNVTHHLTARQIKIILEGGVLNTMLGQ
jgi:aconitate hydratase